MLGSFSFGRSCTKRSCWPSPAPNRTTRYQEAPGPGPDRSAVQTRSTFYRTLWFSFCSRSRWRSELFSGLERDNVPIMEKSVRHIELKHDSRTQCDTWSSRRPFPLWHVMTTWMEQQTVIAPWPAHVAVNKAEGDMWPHQEPQSGIWTETFLIWRQFWFRLQFGGCQVQDHVAPLAADCCALIGIIKRSSTGVVSVDTASTRRNLSY